jgi:hypothetical protein
VTSAYSWNYVNRSKMQVYNSIKIQKKTQNILKINILVQNTFNPFESNFSANRILPSSYLFWAGKRLVDYL